MKKYLKKSAGDESLLPLYEKIRSWKLPISGRIDHSMLRAWRPLGVRMLVNDDWRLLGVRRLVNDDKEEDWLDIPHARA